MRENARTVLRLRELEEDRGAELEQKTVETQQEQDTSGLR
jgi:hypothetical protein